MVSHSSPEYQRAWREKNHKRTRLWWKNWREQHKEELKISKKLRYEKHKPEILKNQKIYHALTPSKVLKTRLEIVKLLGNKCVRCNFSDIRCLQIDHVESNGYEERHKFGTQWKYYGFILDQVKKGSKDYQILCSNCNWIKRYEKRETKKREILNL